MLLRGGNNYAVQWVNWRRGGREPCSGALMRLLGVLEFARSWFFQAKHMPGVMNTTADEISRWERAQYFCLPLYFTYFASCWTAMREHFLNVFLFAKWLYFPNFQGMNRGEGQRPTDT